VADLACRIHHSRPQVVPFADVTFRLQQAGYAVTIDQVKDAVVHRESECGRLIWPRLSARMLAPPGW